MGNLTAKTSGEIASFMSPSMTNIKSLKVHFSPKQLGTGDPSPENVREIEGWDGVEAYNDPKYGGFVVWNQCFDPSTIKIGSGTSGVFNATKLDTGFRVTANADASGSGSRVIYFTVKWNRIQNHRYIFLCKIKSNTLKFSSVYFYHANGSSNRPVQNSTGQYAMIETYTGSTATTNASPRLYIYGIELLEGESFEVTDLMAIDLDMMFGTTVIDNLFNNTTTSLQRVDWFTSIITNYNYRDYNEGEITTVSAVNNEPYTNLSIDWSSDIGTTYGGYVDLISGELVEKCKTISFQWGNYRENSDRDESVLRTFENENIENVKFIAAQSNGMVCFSHGIWKFNTRSTLHTPRGFIDPQTNTIYAIMPPDTNDSTEMEICYELATPITHQFTPTQLKSFVGQNNFWSNADYVEVEYDLIETIDIQKAKQKIILNQPHIESVKDDIANFTTNIKAPLKECKVYFEPVQEGEGDPSPDNIRPISGWEGMNLNVNSINLWGGNITDSSSGKRLSSYGATGGYPRLKKNINPNTYTISVICNLPSGETQDTWSKSYNIRMWFKSAIDGKWYEIVSASTGELRPATSSGSVLFTWTQPADISSTPIKFVSHPFKLTIPVSCIALGFYKYGNYLEYTSIQLEVGNTASDIEPYNGTTIPISWANEVGTCYGGYLDLVNGILAVTNQINIIDNSKIIRDTATRYHITKSNIGNINSLAFARMNKFRHHLTSDGWNASGTFFLDSNNLQMNAYQEFDTKADFIEAYGELKLCYTLAEPIYYQLTPQQLLAFKGTNNIWSDTNGQTEVKFWTH